MLESKPDFQFSGLKAMKDLKGPRGSVVLGAKGGWKTNQIQNPVSSEGKEARAQLLHYSQ